MTSARQLGCEGSADREVSSVIGWYHWAAFVGPSPSRLVNNDAPFHRIDSPMPSAISSMVPGSLPWSTSDICGPSTGPSLLARAGMLCPSELRLLRDSRSVTLWRSDSISFDNDSRVIAFSARFPLMIAPLTNTASRRHPPASPRLTHAPHG